MAKTTIYRIVKRFEQEGSVAWATRSGRRATKMTHDKMAQLKRLVDHKTGISQRSLAVWFGCTQGYIISRTAKILNIRCSKRTKVKQNENAEKCRTTSLECWLHMSLPVIGLQEMWSSELQNKILHHEDSQTNCTRRFSGCTENTDNNQYIIDYH